MKKLLALILALMLILCSCGPKEIQWYTEGDITYTAEDMQEFTSAEFKKPKNVILMIGDGMGLNDLQLSRDNCDFLFDFGLAIDCLPNRGFATTYSADSDVTDSAASATALATGYKTNNKMIGKAPDGTDLLNLGEIARAEGKKVGIVTSDGMTGATPSAFAVHNISRENEAELANSLVEFAPDVLIGNTGYRSFKSALSEENKALLETYTLAQSFDEFKTVLDGDIKGKFPFFGFIYTDSYEKTYDLAHYTETALNRLENKDGFFLMVENTGADKAGHNKNPQGKVDTVAVFDKAVAVAMEYCKENPDTLLIVTSDHETGGVILNDGYVLDKSIFSGTEHTGVDVGVFALGYGTEYFNEKTVDNTDIAKFVISAVKGELE